MLLLPKSLLEQLRMLLASVLGEATVTRVGLLAVVALERSFAGMRARMNNEKILRDKGLITVVALEWQIAQVTGLIVHVALGGRLEGFVAVGFGAEKRSLIRVHTEVNIEIALAKKRLAAVLTVMRLLLVVQTNNVIPMRFRLSETHRTEMTLEGTLARMQTLVLGQIVLERKCLVAVTARMRTLTSVRQRMTGQCGPAAKRSLAARAREQELLLVSRSDMMAEARLGRARATALLAAKRTKRRVPLAMRRQVALARERRAAKVALEEASRSGFDMPI